MNKPFEQQAQEHPQMLKNKVVNEISRRKVLYGTVVITVIVVMSTLLIYQSFFASEESVERTKILFPLMGPVLSLIGSVISMIIGVVLIILAAMVYSRSPEHGKDGWGIIAVGCALILLSYAQSAEITTEGIKFNKGSSSETQNTIAGLNSGLAEQRGLIDDLQNEIKVLKSSLKERRDDSDSEKRQTDSDLGLVDRALKSPALLLPTIDQALASLATPLDKNDWSRLINAANENKDIQQGFMERVPKIIEHFEGISEFEGLQKKLMTSFSKYISSEDLNLDSNLHHLKALFEGANSVFGEKFPGNPAEYRLYLAYVRAFGVNVSSFRSVKTGDLLAVSREHSSAPLRSGMPNFFGRMKPEIRWNSQSTLLRVIEGDTTKTNAPWLHVEVAYTDGSTARRVGDDGFIAWFDDRFISAAN